LQDNHKDRKPFSFFNETTFPCLGILFLFYTGSLTLSEKHISSAFSVQYEWLHQLFTSLVIVFHMAIVVLFIIKQKKLRVYSSSKPAFKHIATMYISRCRGCNSFLWRFDVKQFWHFRIFHLYIKSNYRWCQIDAEVVKTTGINLGYSKRY